MKKKENRVFSFLGEYAFSFVSCVLYVRISRILYLRSPSGTAIQVTGKSIMQKGTKSESISLNSEHEKPFLKHNIANIIV